MWLLPEADGHSRASRASSPSSIASLRQQFASSARWTLSFSLCALLSGSATPVSSNSTFGKVSASAATSGSPPPLPAFTGAHPQVWEHARRKASKARPDTSIRCGAPAFKKRTVTSAPHGARARLRRCSSTAALALAVSSPGASRTLIFARATGTSLFAASAVGGASIPRTATAGRPPDVFEYRLHRLADILWAGPTATRRHQQPSRRLASAPDTDPGHIQLHFPPSLAPYGHKSRQSMGGRC